MKKGKIFIERTIILITISTSAGLRAAYLREKGAIYQQKDPPPGIASSRRMTESEPTSNKVNKIRPLPKLGIDRHGFPKNSIVLNDCLLMIRYVPPLESLSSESLCAVSTTPKQ
ncbi:hypothetical protein AYI68_g8120 [Smittium mucronatum]|uniref:Uncharacterized protein n=1 Tax=Smittium mucronatum TaxID=133383 RepID=A0A1R0GLR5_9FUNG|nr:hypothetical protein AYI68_g8120 [Smittium mucronatum]